MLHDKHLISPGSNDATHNSSGGVLDAGENLPFTGENLVQNGAQMGANGPYVMCVPSGSSTGVEDDLPVAANGAGSESP